MPRLLIVEDNFWLALALTEEVEELGWRPVGPARNLSDALILARNSKLDAALLDFDLGGVNSLAVARILVERCVPFTFATGGNENAGEPFQNVPTLPKPFNVAALRTALGNMLNRPS
jgi:DNA-binding response OmpR family regulator